MRIPTLLVSCLLAALAGDGREVPRPTGDAGIVSPCGADTIAGWRSEIATTVSALASITNAEAVSAGRRVRSTIVASSAIP